MMTCESSQIDFQATEKPERTHITLTEYVKPNAQQLLPCLFHFENLISNPSEESEEEFVTLDRYVQLKCKKSEWLEMDQSFSSSMDSTVDKHHNPMIRRVECTRPKFVRQKTIRMRTSMEQRMIKESQTYENEKYEDRILRLVEHIRQTVSCQNFLDIHQPFSYRKEQSCDLQKIQSMNKRNIQITMLNSYVGQMDLVEILSVKSWITPYYRHENDNFISEYQVKQTKKNFFTSFSCGLFKCLRRV